MKNKLKTTNSNNSFFMERHNYVEKYQQRAKIVTWAYIIAAVSVIIRLPLQGSIPWDFQYSITSFGFPVGESPIDIIALKLSSALSNL